MKSNPYSIKALDKKALLGIFGVVLLLCIFFIEIHKETWGALVGIALPVIALSFYNFKYLWYVGILAMPISLELSELVGGSALTIPSDLIAAGFSLLFLLKAPSYKKELQKVFSHPITIALTLYFIWMGITSLFAEKPIVAIKFTLNTYWYLSTYFFWTILFLKDNKKDFHNWLYIIAIPLVLVVLHTMYQHGLKGFTKQSSYYIMRPFYKEHTAYAASIAVFIPLYLVLAVYGNFKKRSKVFFIVTCIIVLMGVIFSYTRGAWLGLLVAFGVFLILKYWGFFRVAILFMLPFLIGGVVYLYNNPEVFHSFSHTANAISRQGLSKNVQSMVNLRTDYSNKERLNRWVAALNMMEARPLTGFGPGNYAMTYAPFQEHQYLTHISTFRGDGGTAHSEYLLAASEMGVLGLILITLWLFTVAIKGFQGVLNSPYYENRILYLAALLGYLTYFIHSFFNNFLDQDKVAIPVYFCMAMIVTLDTFYSYDTD